MFVMPMVMLITAPNFLFLRSQSSGRADDKRLEDAIRAQDESRERELAHNAHSSKSRKKPNTSPSAWMKPELATACCRHLYWWSGNPPPPDWLRLLAADWNVGEELKIPIRLRRSILLKNSLLQLATGMGLCLVDEAHKPAVKKNQHQCRARTNSGSAICRLAGKRIRSTPSHFLHQRLRYLAVGRP